MCYFKWRIILFARIALILNNIHPSVYHSHTLCVGQSTFTQKRRCCRTLYMGHFDESLLSLSLGSFDPRDLLVNTTARVLNVFVLVALHILQKSLSVLIWKTHCPRHAQRRTHPGYKLKTTNRSDDVTFNR